MKPFLFVLTLTTSCASDLRDGPHDNSPAATSLVHTEEQTDNLFLSTVDASSSDTWTYFAFNEATEVAVDDPTVSTAWDLGFQRFAIQSNGGASGPGNVAVAKLAAAFDDVHEAPDTGYLSDQAGTELAFDAGETWWSYDGASHLLSPRPGTFVVRTQSRTVKMAIQSYYDAAGTSGHISFLWSVLAP